MAQVTEIAVDTRLLDEFTHIASRAAAVIRAIPPGALAQREKSDRSPVTAADEASQALILAALQELLPNIPVISEEATNRTMSPDPGTPFVLVDPLDGTRELLAGRDEFTVNIALVSGGRPVLGVVAAPARGMIWRGIVDSGAERLALAPGQPPNTARERVAIRTRMPPANGLVAVMSRSHLDSASESYLARRRPAQRIACGSALKFGLLAEGTADLYARLSTTAAWDVAAGHAVLAAAGGAVAAPDGTPLNYRQPGYRIPAFIAAGDPRQIMAL